MRKIFIILMIVVISSGLLAVEKPNKLKESLNILSEKLDNIKHQINDDEKETIFVEVEEVVKEIEAEKKEIEAEKKEIQAEKKEIKIELNKIGEDFKEIKVFDSNDSKNAEKAWIGIYLGNVNEKFKSKTGYDKDYGIKILGVVSNSPARKAGIGKNDILFKIDEYEVKNVKSVGQILSYYHPGDSTNFHIYRMGKEVVKPLILGNKKQYKKIKIETLSEKRTSKFRKNIEGGIFWTPVWFEFEGMDDINKIYEQNGFSGLDDDYLFTNGFAFKFSPDKNFLLGFSYQYFRNQKSNKNQLDFYNPVTGEMDSTDVKRKFKFQTKFVGGTLDYKLIQTKRFNSTFGFMLGYGQLHCRVTEDKQLVENSDDNGIYSYYDKKVYLKEFLAFQPRLTVGYTLLQHLGIRAEIGYMLDYGLNEWKTTNNGDSFDFDELSDTNFRGMTISVGPWFTF